MKAGILSGHSAVAVNYRSWLVLISSTFNLVAQKLHCIIGVEKWRNCYVSALLTERIVSVTVDETHCVSKWSFLYMYMYM